MFITLCAGDETGPETSIHLAVSKDTIGQSYFLTRHSGMLITTQTHYLNILSFPPSICLPLLLRPDKLIARYSKVPLFH